PAAPPTTPCTTTTSSSTTAQPCCWRACPRTCSWTSTTRSSRATAPTLTTAAATPWTSPTFSSPEEAGRKKRQSRARGDPRALDCFSFAFRQGFLPAGRLLRSQADDEAVPALPLGLVQQLVRRLVQLLRRPARGDGLYADAAGHPDLLQPDPP